MKVHRYLSLGAGVQSATIALMMKHGEIEPCEAAIFADTKAEPKRVYIWLDWLEKQLPFPVYKVTEKNGLTADIENCLVHARSTWCSGPPLFTMSAQGNIGVIHRECTGDFKLAPISRKINELRNREPIISIIGFSSDEQTRCKPPNRKYIVKNEWPLIERRMSRHDCINWMHKHYYQTPPRSACVYCPYKCDAEWRILRDSDPEGWAEAVRMDKIMRNMARKGVDQPCFVHRSCKPLDEVDLRTDFQMGQLPLAGIDCEGMCGV
jgi:hypothetical protein